jgi:hypothetical protein
MPRRWLLALALVAACVAADEPIDDPSQDVEDGGKDDRGGTPTFLEVDPARSSANFRRYVTRAIEHLERDSFSIARLTARSIRDGRVRIDELRDLTCHDAERARAEGSLDELDGYMWSNRIYVSRGQTTALLAATLVHEVNHVINRSEVGYWDDLPTSAFLHEYRAFHAERMFDPEPYEGVDLVDHVLELYELDRAAIPASVLARPLTPRMLPDATAWRLRDVASDPPDAPCAP